MVLWILISIAQPLRMTFWKFLSRAEAVISLSREVKNEKHRRWNTFDVPFVFFFGWCPMFLVNFLCDFVERMM